MIAVRQMTRLGFQPARVRRLRHTHERQRAAECIDDLLIVPVLE